MNCENLWRVLNRSRKSFFHHFLNFSFTCLVRRMILPTIRSDGEDLKKELLKHDWINLEQKGYDGFCIREWFKPSLALDLVINYSIFDLHWMKSENLWRVLNRSRMRFSSFSSCQARMAPLTPLILALYKCLSHVSSDCSPSITVFIVTTTPFLISPLWVYSKLMVPQYSNVIIGDLMGQEIVLLTLWRISILLEKSMQAPTISRKGVPKINGTLLLVIISKTVRSMRMVHAPIFKGNPRWDHLEL